MLPIRMDILEIPRGDCRVGGRREPDRLSQCLVCGALTWASDDGDTECRCQRTTVARGTQLPELASSAV